MNRLRRILKRLARIEDQLLGLYSFEAKHAAIIENTLSHIRYGEGQAHATAMQREYERVVGGIDQTPQEWWVNRSITPGDGR